MNILIINPNSTASMTASIAAAAKRVARPGTKIEAVNPDDTPKAIQGPEDGAAALPGLFRVFDEKVLGDGGYDACIIACFDDTGLIELKARSPIPVLGIGEAAYMTATLLGERFTVITTLSVSIPVLQENLERYGLAKHCARIRAAEVPVLALETDKDAARTRIVHETGMAIQEDNSQSIVLGCAGMAELARELSGVFQIPMIDGVTAAVSLAEALGQSGAIKQV